MRLFVVVGLCLISSVAFGQGKRPNPAPAEPEVMIERLVPDPVDLDEVDLGGKENLDAPLFDPTPPGYVELTEGEWPAKEKLVDLRKESATPELPAVIYGRTEVSLQKGRITVYGRNAVRREAYIGMHIKGGGRKFHVLMCSEAVFNELTLAEGSKPMEHDIGLIQIRNGISVRYNIMFVRKAAQVQELFVPVTPPREPVQEFMPEAEEKPAPKGPVFKPGDKVADQPGQKKAR